MIDDAHDTPSFEAASPDDLHALAAELAVDEDLSPVEALSQALALHDELLALATIWDVDAALMGNPDQHKPQQT